MFKVVKVRVAVLANQIPVPSLPIKEIGRIVGFRMTYNGASAFPPMNVTLPASTLGTAPIEVVNAQVGTVYTVDCPIFGDESSVITAMTSNTLDAYWVDFDVLVETNHAE